MSHKEKNVSVSRTIILLLVIASVLILKIAFIRDGNWYWGLLVTLPLLLIAVVDVWQSKYSAVRNYPLIGRLHDFLESIRHKFRQYFFESKSKGI